MDPSFLEALPPEIRREVLEQHRILCLQQRLATRTAETTNATAATAEASNSNEVPQEVSPEFLAALPPALQEEVLTQQRLEQQRQAAARAPPNEPFDAQSFFQTLPPSLRTMVSNIITNKIFYYLIFLPQKCLSLNIIFSHFIKNVHIFFC